MKHVYRITVVAFGLLIPAFATGCKKHDELPSEWTGRYRRTALFGLTSDQFVVVAPHQLSVENCQVNCGVPIVPLTTVRCTGNGSNTECTYVSEHCTGSISATSEGQLSITATATPSAATGEALALHGETCENIRANLMPRAQ